MEKLKKLIALILAASLVAGMAGTVFADESNSANTTSESAAISLESEAEESEENTQSASTLSSSYSDSTNIAKGTTGTCHWYITSDGALTFTPVSGSYGTLDTYDTYRDVPWYKYKSKIKSVTSDDGVIAGTSLMFYFYRCTSLKTVSLESWSTSKAIILDYMFYNCSALKSIDLSGWNTSSVISRNSMFYGCSALSSVTLGEDWDWTYGSSKSNTASTVTNGALPTPDISSGGWVHLGPYVKLATSGAIAKGWCSDYAGTWVWYEDGYYYIVTFMPNCSEYEGSMSIEYVAANDATTLRTNAYSRTGYAFAGWSASSTGSVQYKDGASITATADTKLYAVWEANTYTIKFKPNGGTGTMSALTASYGKSVKLTANAFKRTGYTFNGWNTEKDGSGTSYKNKAAVKNLTDTANGTVTLYAQWEKNSSTSSSSSASSSGSSSDSYTEPSSSASPSSVDLTGATASQVSNTLSKLTSDDDLKGSSYSGLQAQAKKVAKKNITVKWKKVSGAKKYVVYANACGKGKKLKTLKTTTSTKLKVAKVAGKKLKSGKYYKFLVVAYDSSGKVISTSKVVHAATKGSKNTNAKKLKVTESGKKVSSLSLKAKGSAKIKAKVTKTQWKGKIKNHRKTKYESTNTGIATVSANGKITAKKKGTCYIYAYAQNGISKKVKVTVK